LVKGNILTRNKKMRKAHSIALPLERREKKKEKVQITCTLETSGKFDHSNVNPYKGGGDQPGSRL